MQKKGSSIRWDLLLALGGEVDKGERLTVGLDWVCSSLCIRPVCSGYKYLLQL